MNRRHPIRNQEPVRKIKIAHIITRLELGGAQQNTLYCCGHHDRRKYDVILIAGSGGYLDRLISGPGFSRGQAEYLAGDHAPAKWRPEGSSLDGEAQKIKDCRTYLIPELLHPIQPVWDFLALQRITEILKSEKVDLVHTHSSKAGILGRWAAKRAGVPHIIHTVHGWGFYEGQFFPVRRLYQALERWAAKFTDILITVSGENKNTGLKAGIGREEQYRVIHSGIDPKRYTLSRPAALKARKLLGSARRPAVLVLSNFKSQKSPLDVVRVAGLLVKEMPDVLFLWAGDGELRGEVENLIRENKLENNFKLLGWREDVAELLAASDVLLLTSLYEGLPRVVLQAMAAGKPVVATSVSGTPEAVKDGKTGYLHAPHDAEGMAQSLQKILSKGKLAVRMGTAGRQALKGTFLIQKMLQEIEKIYRELVR